MKRFWMGLLMLGALAMGASVAAQDMSVRGGFSGSWFDPDHDLQGVLIEVVDARRAAVYWYTYDSMGEPVWLFGVGDIRGDTIEVTLDSYRGGLFPTAANPGTVDIEPWGTAEIEFSDCQSAELRWDTTHDGFENGTLPLTRLTGIEGQRCGEAEAFERTISFSFEQGADAWAAVFSDFSEPQADSIDTDSEWMPLPEPLADRNGLMLTGRNTSDDLAMFFKTPIGGLAPSTEYRVELDMTFATSVPRDCAGAGGSPGNSVYVKLGAADIEPETVIQEGELVPPFHAMNIDKGNQSQGGEDALVVGNMTNFQEDCPPIEDREWQLKTVSTQGKDFTATTDEAGTLWVYGGTDSGFEGTTVYFVTDFTARLAPVSD